MGGMGPGAPGLARAHPIADTGKLWLAHATRLAASHAGLRPARMGAAVDGEDDAGHECRAF